MNTYEKLKKEQPRVIQLLSNCFIKDRFSHAYLFYGNKGVGKKSCAILLAKMFLCKKTMLEGKPCESCTDCMRIEKGNHPDVHIVKPDGASIKTEQIQLLQKEYIYSGMESNKKVFIIEDCDCMTVQAANRMLKTIEEPLPGILTVLTTDRKAAVLPTIQSRTQQVSFQDPSFNHMFDALQRQGVSPELTKVIMNITTDFEEAVLLGNESTFADSYALVLKLYETLESNKEAAYIFIQTDWLPHFGVKDREKNILGLSLLYVLFKDILLRKLGQQNHYQMNETKKCNIDLYSEESLFRILDEIQLVQKKIKQNFNIQIALESFMVYLQEV